MRASLSCLPLLAACACAAPAQAQNWFSVSRPQREPQQVQVEVDLDTVRARGTLSEGVIRLNYGSPQPHRSGWTYRSLVATAEFDCQRRTVVLVSAAYFAAPGGQGARLGADSSGHERGMPTEPLESIPPATRHALLRATCATTQNN